MEGDLSSCFADLVGSHLPALGAVMLAILTRIVTTTTTTPYPKLPDWVTLLKHNSKNYFSY